MPMDRLPFFRKTRIAPTPSGYLHLGNAFSFLITASLAKKTGARVLLRIDDLDRQRIRPEYMQDIFDTLRLLGINWDEGPRSAEEQETRFAQMHRLALYRKALQQLRDGGHLFACTCSRTDVLQQHSEGVYPGTCCRNNLSLDAEGVSWRLHTNLGQTIRVKSLDGQEITATLPPAMQAFVVRKKDGMPAYQLTSLVDDLHFGVDLVVRGTDLWPSTLAQLYLASLLGASRFAETTFYHHPLLKNANGEKLSKSAGAASIRHRQKTDTLLADLQAIAEQYNHNLEWCSK